MPTNTQKNFKKQMKKIERENKSNEEFYSYIKKDYINSYYDKQKKKRRRIAFLGIGSLGSLIVVIWNFYAISSWVNHYIFPPNDHSLTKARSFISISDNIHTDIALYLDKLDMENIILNEFMSYRSANFNTVLKLKSQKATFAENIKNYSIKISNSSLNIQNMSPNKELEYYHKLMLQKYDITYQISEFTMKALSSTTPQGLQKNLQKCNNLITQLNIINNKAINELISIFNKVGIKYEESDGNIRYWYNQ